jgi:hypothetical protein
MAIPCLPLHRYEPFGVFDFGIRTSGLIPNPTSPFARNYKVWVFGAGGGGGGQQFPTTAIGGAAGGGAGGCSIISFSLDNLNTMPTVPAHTINYGGGGNGGSSNGGNGSGGGNTTLSIPSMGTTAIGGGGIGGGGQDAGTNLTGGSGAGGGGFIVLGMAVNYGTVAGGSGGACGGWRAGERGGRLRRRLASWWQGPRGW